MTTTKNLEKVLEMLQNAAESALDVVAECRAGLTEENVTYRQKEGQK